MAKRRLSKQQKNRIQQQSYHDAEIGLVLNRYGKQAEIETDSGQIIRCSIRQRVRNLVAGDRVLWQEVDSTHGVIVERLERKSILGRPDKHNKIKAIAANIDTILIVVAAKPELSLSLLDSYLVIAEHLDIDAAIILNKTDLDHKTVMQHLSIYQDLGYEVLTTSAKKRGGIKPLYQVMQNQVGVFVGQSGVGKSSLINSLLDKEIAATGEISQQSELGRHTTSMSKLYHMDYGNGKIIDSPGIREFGLWHMPASDIARGFREFQPLLGQCKFRDCQHKNELGCAITQAVKEQKIAQSRYQSYVKLT